MATQPQQRDHEEADKYVVVNTENGNESDPLDSWEEAQSKRNFFAGMDGAHPEDFEIRPVNEPEGTDDPTRPEVDEFADGGQEQELVEPDTVAAETDVEQSDETPQVEPVEPDTTPAVSNPEALPKINPVEDTARDVISQLDSDDMNRLVWDPDADAQSVPYKPGKLPYDRPEPSAEAFDLFAGIIEGALDVQYSVESVEFEQTDKTYGCTVAIEKQTDQGTKRLVGIKTRQKSQTTGIDHWRERIYSKARRNALKQDIPPTMVSSLLARYRELES